MDLDELARIQAALLEAIAEARIILQDQDRDEQFHEVVRHAREMHDILLEAMIAEPHVVERLRGRCTSLGNAVDELELVARTHNLQRPLFDPASMSDQLGSPAEIGQHRFFAQRAQICGKHRRPYARSMFFRSNTRTYARCRYWIAKERLRQLFDGLYLVHYVEHLDAHGEALFAKVCELDLEGIVAKRADSSYKAGRRPEWVRVKNQNYSQQKASRFGDE